MKTIVCMAGPHGSGKTTIAEKLIQLYLPGAAEIFLLTHETSCQLLINKISISSASLIFIINKLDHDFSEEIALEHLINVKVYIESPLDLCLLRCFRAGKTSFFDSYEANRNDIILFQEKLKEKSDIVIDNSQHIADLDMAVIIDKIFSVHAAASYSPIPMKMINPSFDASLKSAEVLQGKLYVISGPSGVGKNTLITEMLNKFHFLQKVVPYTTRHKRDLEIDGVDYFFVSSDLFKKIKDERVFLQYFINKNTGHEYGLLLNDVKKILRDGISVIVDIFPNGLVQVQEHGLNATSVFLCPPGFNDLSRRLVARDGKVDSDRISHALENFESASFESYDFLIVNDNLMDAVESMSAIILENQLRMNKQLLKQSMLLTSLRLERGLAAMKTKLSPLRWEKLMISTLSSLNNISVKVSVEGEHYFLRVRASDPHYGIVIADEYRNITQVSQHGIYPEVSYYDADHGYYFVRFLNEYKNLAVASVVSQESVLKTIVGSLKKLHALPLFENNYRPIAYIEATAIRIKKKNISLPHLLDTIILFAHRLSELLDHFSDRLYPCHNDVSPYNMLHNIEQGSVVLTDWESSGNNNFYWDLSKLSVEFLLTEVQEELLLQTYFMGVSGHVELAQLVLFKFLVELHLAMWAKWQVVIKNQAALSCQFEHIFLSRLENCRSYLKSNDFYRHIQCLLQHLPSQARSVPILIKSRIEQIFLPKPEKSIIFAKSRLSVFTASSSTLFFSEALVIIKPDAVAKGFSGAIISAIEVENYSISKMKECMLTQVEVEKLYDIAKHVLRYDVLDLMTAGPVILLVIHAMDQSSSDLLELKKRLRSNFAETEKWNALHCSDDAQSACREISLFF